MRLLREHLGRIYDQIAEVLNSRPRKRLGFKTPEECYVQAW
jgi:IS30 family transposase